MEIGILTIFPGIFDSPLGESIIKRARQKGLVDFTIINIRDFAKDIHKTCDDAPYGGGPGMVMKIEPIYNAMEYLEKEKGRRPKYILLTPQGRILNDEMAARLARQSFICLICGRYEGIDERILHFVDEEVSIGDYVLSGGEFPALVLIDAILRHIPGVLGNSESIKEESLNENLLEYPQYTRPQVFMGMEVPAPLLSGNHEEIRKWRRKEAIRKTILKRPDLMGQFKPTEEDLILIREIMEEILE
ncbi:MAG: tRNA (guanosine(37)-N1)-methyltransferase TrmD [Syntrophorhabdaceae bacterium]|nr:tRNA (guanosine(37)-N1)-methyltransferase TrmD [Syntrophorhabdaceae bacterium]